MPMTIEVYEDSGGKSRWRLKSSNGQTIASAGQAYATASNARRAAAAFKANAVKSTFEVYADTGGKHRWRATARGRNQSSYGTKSFFRAPQTGQTHESGMSSNGVPGGIPPSGSPSAGS